MELHTNWRGGFAELDQSELQLPQPVGRAVTMQGQSLRCQRAFTASTPVQRAGRCRLSITCKESRIGRSPIPIPKGVKIDLKGNNLKVKVGRLCHSGNSTQVFHLHSHALVSQGPNGELEVSLDLEYVTIKEVGVGHWHGTLCLQALPAKTKCTVGLQVEGKLLVERASDGRKAFAMHGLSRWVAQPRHSDAHHCASQMQQQ